MAGENVAVKGGGREGDREREEEGERLLQHRWRLEVAAVPNSAGEKRGEKKRKEKEEQEEALE